MHAVVSTVLYEFLIKKMYKSKQFFVVMNIIPQMLLIEQLVLNLKSSFRHTCIAKSHLCP